MHMIDLPAGTLYKTTCTGPTEYTELVQHDCVTIPMKSGKVYGRCLLPYPNQSHFTSLTSSLPDTDRAPISAYSNRNMSDPAHDQKPSGKEPVAPEEAGAKETKVTPPKLDALDAL